MTARATIDLVLEYIDKTLHEPLTLADIAEAAGLSPYHVSRLFTATMGESAMSYVRRRRLAMAAVRLVKEPQTRLIDLAFESGFDSQEAFTRAFRRTLGMTPGEIKRRAGADHFEEEERMMTVLDLSDRLICEEGIRRRGAFRVAGPSGRFDQSSKAAIPALWDRLVPKLPLPGQVNGVTYGVCWGSNPEEGSFNYMAAAEIAAGAAAPAGFEVLDIPEQSYLVFKQALDGGNLHLQMSSAAMEIWSKRIAQSGLEPSSGPDFELYPEDFKGDAPSLVYYWIPVVV